MNTRLRKWRQRLRDLKGNHPWLLVLAVLWVAALLTSIGLWTWLNKERDPSVDAGVAFAVGIVAYFLMGATAALAYFAGRELPQILSYTRDALAGREAQKELLKRQKELEDRTDARFKGEVVPLVWPSGREWEGRTGLVLLNAGLASALDVEAEVVSGLEARRQFRWGGIGPGGTITIPPQTGWPVKTSPPGAPEDIDWQRQLAVRVRWVDVDGTERESDWRTIPRL